MKYITIPYVNKPVSKIIYGTANTYFMEGTAKDSFIDAVYSTGINTFDTARAYTEAEKTLGNWIQNRNNRNDIVLSLIHISEPTRPY